MINKSRFALLLICIAPIFQNYSSAQVVYYGVFKAIDRNDLAAIRSEIEKDKQALNKPLPATGLTPLLMAISQRRVDAVQILLDLGADLNSKDRRGRTPLHLAIMKRRPDVVQLVLEAKPDIDALDNNESTPLMYAMIYRGDEQLVQQLLKGDADVSAKNRSGLTALQMACNYQRPEAALLFLEKGANPNEVDSRGISPFLAACARGMPKVVNKMLELDANPLAENGNKQTALHLACQSSSSETAQLLIPYYKSVDTLDQNGVPPLVYAVYSNQLSTVRELIKKGANPNIILAEPNLLGPLNHACSLGRDEMAKALIESGAIVNFVQSNEGFSPLHFAAEGGKLGRSTASSDRSHAKPYIDTIQILLDNKADIDLKSKSGKTPLAVAAENNFFEAVELLVEKTDKLNVQVGEASLLHWAGKNGLVKTCDRLVKSGRIPIDGLDAIGKSPLHEACEQGHLKVVQLLLSRGANANLSDRHGQTPMHFAAMNNHDEIVEHLAVAGVDVNVRDDSEHTPLHLAAWIGAINAVKKLVELGAEVEPKTQTGYTPIHGAAWQGHAGVVRRLAMADASVDAVDDDGWTPLHKAAFRGHVNVVKILLGRNADAGHKDIAGMTALDKAVSQNHDDVIALFKQQ